MGLEKIVRYLDHHREWRSLDYEGGLLGTQINAVLGIDGASGREMLIGTDQGLRRILSDGQQRLYGYQKNVSKGLINADVLSLMQDRYGLVWIGTRAGVTVMDPTAEIFSRYEPNFGTPIYDGVSSFYEDGDGVFWLGNYGALEKWDRELGTSKKFMLNENRQTDIVWSIDADEAGNLWLAAEGSGLIRFDPKTEQIKFYQGSTHENMVSNLLWSVLIADDGMVWIGTANAGVLRFDPKTETFTNFRNQKDDPNSIPFDQVFPIVQDSQGDIWFGTYGRGVSRLRKDGRSFQTFIDYDHSPGLLVNAIHPSQSNPDTQIWFGTQSGLRCLNPSSGEIRNHILWDDFPTTNVYGVKEDENGMIWTMNYYGLTRLDPATGRIRHFDEREGFNTAFSPNSMFRSSTGEIYMGSALKAHWFLPKDVLPAKRLEVALTRIHILSEDGATLMNPHTHRPIDLLESIEMPRNAAGFSLLFSAFDYSGADTLSYAYQLVSSEGKGIGINPKDLPKIFDPFFSTKKDEQHLGLGLTVSHDILVGEHNANLEISSRDGITRVRIQMSRGDLEYTIA